MNSGKKGIAQIRGRFKQMSLYFWLTGVCAVIPFSALALKDAPPEPPREIDAGQQRLNGTRDKQIRKMPPQSAIDACRGKVEGEACAFNSPEGTLEGDCHDGAEHILACRPFRDKPSSQTTQKSSSEQLRPTAHSETVPQRASVPQPSLPNDKLEKESTGSQHQQRKEAKPETAAEPNIMSTSNEKSNLGSIGSYFAVALIASGLTWFVLYRYILVPLRRLRTVTQQLAGGNLSARVGEGLVSRKDEVADLGRDVDRMAERIENLVGAHQRLIRDVSHELRSPLARLNVALELARQSAGPAHHAPFDRIERESDRLNELIGQLLMLTKLESDDGLAKREVFDIATIIGDIAQDADFEALSNDRRVITAASDPLFLNGNKELLRQAIENLIRNAVRYTAPGTSVEISLRKRESGGRSWAHIEVRDQGPGVPEAELYDIFRPFYRVNDARERQSGGTGVGLAISDRAVRLHGGSLRAFNAPGIGLIMEMELPLG